MNKDELSKLANDPKYIPGIYNYCDRWCERCPFTSRCLNYKIGEEQFDGAETNDIANEKFWEQLAEVFKLTFELVEDMIDEMDIDINDFDLESEKLLESEIDKKIDKNVCVMNAFEYIETTNSWFESAQNLFEQKEEQLSLETELDLPESSPFDDALTINDAVEVIRWYQHQIYVKLKRAFHGKYMDILYRDEEEEDEYPKDSDGSAKVALIGIDRSIAAWGKLQNQFVEQEDEILDILVHLSKLRKQVELEFPDARAFKRIGFDD